MYYRINTSHGHLRELILGLAKARDERSNTGVELKPAELLNRNGGRRRSF
jgi:hypothetical protein